MSVTQSSPFTLQGVSEYPNPAFATDPTQPEFLPDPNATATWAEDSGGTACALSAETNDAGTSTVLVTPATDLAADTVVNVTGYGTDTDGHATPISGPYTFTVPAAVAPPSTDATQFVITGVVTPEVPAVAAAAASGSAPAAVPTVESINAAEAAAQAAAVANPVTDVAPVAPAVVAPVSGTPPTVASVNAAETAAQQAAQTTNAEGISPEGVDAVGQ